MSDTTRTVAELLRLLDYPMFIVTATDGRERAGCLIGFATQISIHPPRFLVGLSDKNRTFRVAQGASLLVVHLVAEDAVELAELFGGQTGDEVDKFARCAWHPGPEGTPVLDACENWFAGRILERIPAGDHWAFILDPIDAHADDGEEPFTFHRARRIEPGHDA